MIYRGSVIAYSTLGNLRKERYSEEVVVARFKEYDRDNSGYLDTQELSALCLALGTQLSRNELESALFILDKDGDGKIELNEFVGWWSGKDDLIV